MRLLSYAKLTHLRTKSTVFQSIIALNFTFLFISEKLFYYIIIIIIIFFYLFIFFFKKKKKKNVFLSIVENGGQGTGVFNLF